MTYITTPPCIDCKYTDCAAVCPVEAFHDMSYADAGRYISENLWRAT